MAMAHIDKVFTEFPFFHELFQLLHIECILQKGIMLVPLVDDSFPAGPSPDGEGGGEEIVVWYIRSDLFVIETGNHGDAGILFVPVQHFFAEGEERYGRHVVIFQYDAFVNHGKGPFL